MAAGPTLSTPDHVEVVRRRWIFRHPLVIRLAHWINAVCLLVLLMSGLQIFNAHPALYWGQASTFDDPLLAILDEAPDAGEPRGVTTVLGRSFDTTGVLGLSTGANGLPAERAFPPWATLPSGQDLATGRRWHYLFAWAFVINGLIYLAYGVGSGQLWTRVIPSGDQVRHIGGAIWEHLTLRFPRGDAARRYNVIQKLSYLAVILVLLPAQLLSGLAMSPAMDAALPILVDLFGGRQSARTVHFVAAGLLVLFAVVHVVIVLLSGFWNNMRGMLTGWFVIERRTLAEERGESR